MVKSLLIIFVIFCAVFVQNSTQKCSRNYHFDYILLATQWPETFCEHNKCTFHKDRWLIHGAWPENNNGTWPQYCCTDHPYNHDDVKPIEADLIANWKTLKADGNNDQFWSHEYMKHGTCAIQCPLMKDEFHYFDSTLKAFKKLQLDQQLKNAGIVPEDGKTYSIEEFHSALQKGLGHRVQLQCYKSQQHEYPIISQINICLAKQDLSLIECPKSMKDRNCASKIGYLPTKK